MHLFLVTFVFVTKVPKPFEFTDCAPSFIVYLVIIHDEVETLTVSRISDLCTQYPLYIHPRKSTLCHCHHCLQSIAGQTHCSPLRTPPINILPSTSSLLFPIFTPHLPHNTHLQRSKDPAISSHQVSSIIKIQHAS